MRALLLVALLSLPLAGCLEIPFQEVPTTTGMKLFAMAPIQRGDPTPVPVASCADLLETLNERALRQARVQLEQSVQNRYGGVAVDFEMSDDSVASAPQAATASGGARAYDASKAAVTGTNNQEQGVDEADFVKTDGEWTYVFQNSILYILHSDEVGEIEEFSRVVFPETWSANLLLEARDPRDDSDDRLVLVLGQPSYHTMEDRVASSSMIRAASGMTRIVVLSLENRGDPEILDEQWIEGQDVGARLVGGVAYIVVHQWEQDLGLTMYAYPDEQDLKRRGHTWESFAAMSPRRQQQILEELAVKADLENQERIEELGLGDHLPVILRQGSSGLVRAPIDNQACQDVWVTRDSTGRGFSTILSIDIADDGLPSATNQVLGGNPIVYAADDALVLAAPSQDFWWFWAQPDLEEATDLTWFTLDGLDVKPRASGRVEGIVQDSFGLDVEGDELRVATTTGQWGRWWMEDPDPMMNHVAKFEALAGKLVPRGIVGGIAPGERIWSARFTEDRAYLVTFRQMDPLWVIDLEGAPKILGELEIPGVSTYIHPLDDDTLLTIGLGPGPNGQDLDWSKIQVSLFDISNPKNPVRADVLTLSPGPNGYGWSGAVHEHKAFTYWDAVDTLAIPLTVQRSYEVRRAGGMEWVNDYNVGLRLITVDRENLDLRMRGEVNQDSLVGRNEWGGEIQRSYFLGFPETGPVSVYAVSNLGITAHDLETLAPQEFALFDLPDYYYGHYEG